MIGDHPVTDRRAGQGYSPSSLGLDAAFNFASESGAQLGRQGNADVFVAVRSRRAVD